MAHIFLIVVLACLASSCSTLPKHYPRSESRAWDKPGETLLGEQLAARLSGQPGESGFYLLSSGLDAFAARVLLANAAQKTIDLQYYVFHADLTGKFLLERLLAAAERGVRVRLLIDDMYTAGKDRTIAALASHPNFEIRVFNPFAERSSSSRVFEWLSDFSRVNRRMHNKMFVVDGVAGIVGGRNVGDEYFAAREDENFADLDLLVAGPVVADLGGVFDAYWNSESAFPIEAFVPDKPTPAELEAVSGTLAAHRDAARDTPYAVRLRESDLVLRLQRGESRPPMGPCPGGARPAAEDRESRGSPRGGYLVGKPAGTGGGGPVGDDPHLTLLRPGHPGGHPVRRDAEGWGAHPNSDELPGVE